MTYVTQSPIDLLTAAASQACPCEIHSLRPRPGPCWLPKLSILELCRHSSRCPFVCCKRLCQPAPFLAMVMLACPACCATVDLLTSLRLCCTPGRAFAGDQDSTTTKLSDGGHSLQLDWQLRSKVGLQLLFKRKVGSTGVPMRAAVEDLRGESGNLAGVGGTCFAVQGKAASSQPACHSSIRLLKF